MNIIDLIKAGQSDRIAWARCRDGVHTEVFETICAMANTAGGEMLLGISADGSITGLQERAVGNVIQGMVRAFENQDNFSPVLHLVPREIVVDGKHLIQIHIPESADIHTLRGKVYVRKGGATIRLGHGTEMARLYEKKCRQYTDGKIYPYLKKSDLNMALLRRMQKRLRINNPEHPLAGADENRLLEGLNLLGADYETGEKGFRFAAALLVGNDDAIRNIFAGVTFCIEDRRSKTVTREYLDTNLMDTYERLTEITGEVLGASGAAEYAAGILVKKDYNDMSPVTITMTNNTVTSDIDAHTSVKGNPVLERIFRECAMDCELYAARKKMTVKPVYARDVEEDVSKTFNKKQVDEAENRNKKDNAVQSAFPEGRRAEVLRMMKEDEQIGVGVMAEQLGVAKRTILRDIDKLKKMGIVERVGPEKGGRWVVH